MAAHIPQILIVDDEPHNLQVFQGMLEPETYNLFQVGTGFEALSTIEEQPPDIILLDIMMPGMSGFEVCKQLKSDPKTQFIPIVLVTALSDQDSKIQGLESGADDFLNKPVDAVELRARVKSLLRTKTLHDELEKRYEELQALDQMRESLTQMIVHDLRNPLSAMLGFFDIMHMQGLISKDAMGKKMTALIKSNGQTMLDMTNALLDLAKLEAGEMQLNLEAVVLNEVLDEVKTNINTTINQRQLQFEIQQPTPPLTVQADREILRRILANIIDNAVKFSPTNGRVIVTATSEENAAWISVQDQGPGIPEAFQDKIFEKFGQVEAKQSGKMISTGLGLAFCKMAVERHGGKIGVNSTIDQGSIFWFTLKR